MATAHWLRDAFADLAFEVHDTVADRDDFGMATQLGWVPPTPSYLWRMARAKRRAARAANRQAG